MRSAKQDSAADIAALKGQLSELLAVLLALANAARECEVGSYTLERFRTRHKLSESQYHKLRRQGRGPRVMDVGGVRVSREADRDWIAERETEAEVTKETGIISALGMQPAPTVPTLPTSKSPVAKPLIRPPRGVS